MADQRDANPYVDKVLDDYRTAVKSWQRQILLTTVVFLLTGLFFVVPAVRWSEKQAILEEGIKQITSKRQKLEAIITQVESLQGKFAAQSEKIRGYGQDLAAGLSERLSAFARAVETLRQPAGLPLDIPTESFPGARITEQFSRPAEGSVPRDPQTFLRQEYELSEGEIRLLQEAHQESPEWDKATEVVKDVYYRQIDHTYATLNTRVRGAIEYLTTETETTFAAVGPRLDEFRIALPMTTDVIPEVSTIRRPLDDRLFTTREGKRRALREDTEFVAVDLDAAQEPLRGAHQAMVRAAKRLDGGFTALEARHHEVMRVLTELEDQVAAVSKELSGLAVPIDWIPLALGMSTVVNVYPILFAVLFFLLLRRLRYICMLRERLYGECRRQGMHDDDIDLVLLTPYTTFSWVAGERSARWHSARIPRSIASILILGFLVGLTWYVGGSRSFKTAYWLLPHIVAVALTIWTGYCVNRLRCRPS
jgi:hypothetical protein